MVTPTPARALIPELERMVEAGVISLWQSVTFADAYDLMDDDGHLLVVRDRDAYISDLSGDEPERVPGISNQADASTWIAQLIQPPTSSQISCQVGATMNAKRIGQTPADAGGVKT